MIIDINVPSLVLHLLTSKARDAAIRPYLNSCQRLLLYCSLVSSSIFLMTASDITGFLKNDSQHFLYILKQADTLKRWLYH